METVCLKCKIVCIYVVVKDRNRDRERIDIFYHLSILSIRSRHVQCYRNNLNIVDVFIDFDYSFNASYVPVFLFVTRVRSPTRARTLRTQFPVGLFGLRDFGSGFGRMPKNVGPFQSFVYFQASEHYTRSELWIHTFF